MIKEDYVSFDTAKLLKEKGFDEPCALSHFDLDAYKKWFETAPRPITIDADSEKPFRYPVPTLQMAMKWLREKHNIHIGVLVTYQCLPRKYEIHIMDTVKNEDIVVSKGTSFNTNEEACEEAIKYTLENLI